MTTPHRRRLAAIDDPLESRVGPAPAVRQDRASSERRPALFVRLPLEQADALARAAFELRAHKRELISALVARYVDPYSEDSMRALQTLLDEHRRLSR